MENGKTEEDGRTERRLGKQPENIKVLLGEGIWQVYSPDSAYSLERDEEDAEEEGVENE